MYIFSTKRTIAWTPSLTRYDLTPIAEFTYGTEERLGLGLGIIGLFRTIIGLSCTIIGVFCAILGLFCAQYYFRTRTVFSLFTFGLSCVVYV